MKAIDKTKELVNRFGEFTIHQAWREKNDDAIECALIAVDEIINMCKLYHNHNVVIDTKIYTELSVDYWIEVKQEIEKL